MGSEMCIRDSVEAAKKVKAQLEEIILDLLAESILDLVDEDMLIAAKGERLESFDLTLPGEILKLMAERANLISALEKVKSMREQLKADFNLAPVDLDDTEDEEF